MPPTGTGPKPSTPSQIRREVRWKKARLATLEKLEAPDILIRQERRGIAWMEELLAYIEGAVREL